MMNTTQVIGNLGTNPEIGTKNGKTWARLWVANNRIWMKDGERQEETTWLNVLAFGGLAKTLERLGRGDQVAIAGRLKNRTAEDGKITGLEIIADRVDFLRLKDDQAKAA